MRLTRGQAAGVLVRKQAGMAWASCPLSHGTVLQPPPCGRRARSGSLRSTFSEMANSRVGLSTAWRSCVLVITTLHL